MPMLLGIIKRTMPGQQQQHTEEEAVAAVAEYNLLIRCELRFVRQSLQLTWRLSTVLVA